MSAHGKPGLPSKVSIWVPNGFNLHNENIALSQNMNFNKKQKIWDRIFLNCKKTNVVRHDFGKVRKYTMLNNVR